MAKLPCETQKGLKGHHRKSVQITLGQSDLCDGNCLSQQIPQRQIYRRHAGLALLIFLIIFCESCGVGHY